MFRCLYDYTYECDIQESVVFLFFYYIFEFYITINIAMFIFYVLLGGNFSTTLSNGHTAGLGLIIYNLLLGFTVIPLILNSILLMIIMKKKRLKMKNVPLFSYALTVFLLIFSCFTPTVMGILIGLIPAAFLMQADDNSLENEIKEMEKENLEQMIMVERLLLKEQVTKLRMKKLQQIMKNNEEPDKIISFK